MHTNTVNHNQLIHDNKIAISMAINVMPLISFQLLVNKHL